MLYSKIELICPQSCDYRAVLCLNNAFLTSPFAYCQYHVEYGACQPASQPASHITTCIGWGRCKLKSCKLYFSCTFKKCFSLDPPPPPPIWSISLELNDWLINVLWDKIVWFVQITPVRKLRRILAVLFLWNYPLWLDKLLWAKM